MVDTCLLNHAVLANFGELITVVVGTVSTELQGAYQAPWAGTPIGNTEVQSPNPMVIFKSDEFDAVGANPGDQILRNKKTFTIHSINPVDGDMTHVEMRAY